MPLNVLDINDVIFKRQTFNINIEKTYYKVQVPLRNFHCTLNPDGDH